MNPAAPTDSESPPDRETLRRLLAGTLDAQTQSEVTAALDRHPAWWRLLDRETGSLKLTSQDLVPLETSPVLGPLLAELGRRDPGTVIPNSEAEPDWRDLLTPHPDRGDILGTIDKYIITELIAAGGMGIVFKATDPDLARTVAIKAMHPGLAANGTAGKLFLAEARAVAALEHEHILPIHQIGGEESRPWFVMKHVAGGSLQDVIDSGGAPLPFDQVCRMGRQIANALAAAHRAGLVHRDIKPANILLDETRENLWLTDFGIAQTSAGPNHTRPGTVAGTPAFMAPEQAAGAPAGPQADLFSLGCLLFLLATGKHPIPGDTPEELSRSIQDRTLRSPARENPKLPAWFCRLLEQLLEADPAKRPIHAAAVANALAREKPALSRAQRRRRLALLLCAVPLLALATRGSLEFQPVFSRANAIFAARLSSPYVNANRFGAHRSLREAVQAAHPGDTIEIHHDGRLTLPPLRIPPGKPLALTAAPGRTPHIVSVDKNAPAITTDSALTLSQLTLSHSAPGNTAPPLLSVTGPGLAIEHCRMDYSVTTREPKNLATAILSRGCENISIRNSTIVCWQASCLQLEDSTEDAAQKVAQDVVIDDAIMIGFVVITAQDLARNTLSLEASQSAFSGNVFYVHSSGEPLPGLRFDTRRNIFMGDQSHFWFRGRTAEEIRDRVSWRGSDNLFSETAAPIFLTTSPTLQTRLRHFAISSLPEWEAFTGREGETGAAFARFRSSLQIIRNFGSDPAAYGSAQWREILKPAREWPERGPDLTKLGPETRPSAKKIDSGG